MKRPVATEYSVYIFWILGPESQNDELQEFIEIAPKGDCFRYSDHQVHDCIIKHQNT